MSTALLSTLRQVSARLGSNPMLVQANTGNTSIKEAGTMWIKASGTTLAAADAPDTFVPVDLSAARSGRYPQRASIETAMHALLPWRVVLHVHSVNVVAWAIRSVSQLQLAGRLDGLNWAWIPYVESGSALGRGVQAAWSSAPATNVFILANHGLVICGDTCEEAEALLYEVERRTALPARRTPRARLDLLSPLCAAGLWRLPDSEAVHALAMDRTCRFAARGGVLYPCQHIFFGSPLPFVASTVPLTEAAARYAGKPFIVFENAGVVVSRRITSHQTEILTGLAEVLHRLEPQSPVNWLTDEQVARLNGATYLKPHQIPAASASAVTA